MSLFRRIAQRVSHTPHVHGTSLHFGPSRVKVSCRGTDATRTSGLIGPVPDVNRSRDEACGGALTPVSGRGRADLDPGHTPFYFLLSDERGSGPAFAVSGALAQLARALR